jgi:exonuclease III
MNIRLLSFNVRGLNAPEALENLRYYIHSLRQHPDILFLQEHKLRMGQHQSIAKKLWKEATTWCLEATLGYNHNPLEPGAGKGGVMTMLAPRWANAVHA